MVTEAGGGVSGSPGSRSSLLSSGSLLSLTCSSIQWTLVMLPYTHTAWFPPSLLMLLSLGMCPENEMVEPLRHFLSWDLKYQSGLAGVCCRNNLSPKSQLLCKNCISCSHHIYFLVDWMGFFSTCSLLWVSESWKVISGRRERLAANTTPALKASLHIHSHLTGQSKSLSTRARVYDA